MEVISNENTLSEEMISRVPVEANVIISQGDQQNNGSTSTLLNDGQMDAGTRENEDGDNSAIIDCDIDEAKEAENFVVEFDMDDSNETQIISSNYDRDESRYLLPKETHSTKLNKCYGTLKYNETLNKFLTDIYDKELDLNLKFSNQEINDIREAVEKLVNKLAEKLGEVDSRIKIAEVILLGSAMERSQIVRPCEYDFALTLDILSEPGVVSIIPADPDDSSR